MRIPALAAVVFAALAFLTPAHAASTINYSDLAGNYAGDFSIKLGGQMAKGSVKVVVSVPKSGTSAKVKITGSVKSGGETGKISNLLTFSSGKAFTQKDILYGLSGKNTKATGTAKGGGRKVSFDATFTASGSKGTSRGTAKVAGSKKSKKLTLSNVVKINGGSYTIKISAKAK